MAVSSGSVSTFDPADFNGDRDGIVKTALEALRRPQPFETEDDVISATPYKMLPPLQHGPIR